MAFDIELRDPGTTFDVVLSEATPTPNVCFFSGGIIILDDV